MTITRTDVTYVANLARLSLDDAALDTFAGQIGKILDHVDALGQVDTTNVPPTSHAIFLSNAFREDAVDGRTGQAEAVANAPDAEDGQFVVPKIIG